MKLPPGGNDPKTSSILYPNPTLLARLIYGKLQKYVICIFKKSFHKKVFQFLKKYSKLKDDKHVNWCLHDYAAQKEHVIASRCATALR
jgi:hypothetical protein